MDKYIYSLYDLDDGELTIEKVNAKSFEHAIEKIANQFYLDYTDDANELYDMMLEEHNYVISDIYLLDEI